MAGNELGLDPEIERLSEKWARDPTSLVFAPLADAYRRSNLVDEAIQVLEKGLKNHPNYTSARVVLGRCYQDKRMFELAKEEFRKVLAFDPHNFVALQLMGDVSLAMGQRDEAMKAYRHLLDVQPGNVQARENLETLAAKEQPPKILPPEPHAEEEKAKAAAGRSFADYFSAPSGVAGTEEPSVVAGAARELVTTFDPHGVLTEAEPVSDLEAYPEEGPRVGPRHGEEKISMFTQYLEPQPIAPEETPLEEPGTAPSREEAPEKPFVTVTLARIYERQGFKDKALQVYQQVLDADPTNVEVRTKVEELLRELGPVALPKEAPKTVGEEVALSDLLKADLEEEAPSRPQVSKRSEEKAPPSEEAEKMDLESFQSWLEGLKRG